MAHVSYTDLRGNLAKYMDQVCDNRAPLTVTRQNARSVVMVSEAEYEAMVETLHLLRSPANAAHLRRGLEEAAANRLVKRDVMRRKKAASAA